MPLFTLAELVSISTPAKIYGESLLVAEGLGLPVTSWSTGDETRSQYWVIAEHLASYETIVSGYASAGFLDLAAAAADFYPWLVRLAKQVYDYDAAEATHATCEVELANAGGGLYPISPGDLTFKSSVSNQTYQNTTGGTLASGPGTVLVVTVEADEPGSDSSAAIGEVDTLVTTLLNVTAANATAAIGIDAESAQSIVDGCRAKLGALSPAGPWDAYASVATNSELTGTALATKARVYSDSVTGDVTIYIAGPSGAVGGGVVSAVEAALAQWATPLCITPTVASAVNIDVPIDYELWLYDSVGMSTAEIEAAVYTALESFFAERPIGGDIKAAVGTGAVFHAAIEGVFKRLFGAYFVDAQVTTPAADTPCTLDEVPILGAVGVTAIHLEPRA